MTLAHLRVQPQEPLQAMHQMLMPGPVQPQMCWQARPHRLAWLVCHFRPLLPARLMHCHPESQSRTSLTLLTGTQPLSAAF